MQRLKRPIYPLVIGFLFFISSCVPAATPSAKVIAPMFAEAEPLVGFSLADGTRTLRFPLDFGAHPDFRTEWWYYTGNLQTPQGRPFGFELTVFRVGLLPPNAELPNSSAWYNRSLYFAHFAISDIEANRFYAYERYARPGPGLAGAEASPYHVWLEDWDIAETGKDAYQLQAEQDDISLSLRLKDEMGVILHGADGYSRKGESASNASYYYSQPRLRAEGNLTIDGTNYAVSGLAWKDHEFSASVLDEKQIGWDWFSLQMDNGAALMLFQLREENGSVSPTRSGTWINADGASLALDAEDFEVEVLKTWQSPHTGGVYPSAWQVHTRKPSCQIQISPWMKDQEVNFSAVTYWEGAVQFNGQCNGQAIQGNGYVELTGYAGNLPLP